MQPFPSSYRDNRIGNNIRSKMSIVRAVIYFQWLHLIIGFSIDHCDKLSIVEYKCVFNVSSANSQFSVHCHIFGFEIKNVDSNIGKAFDEDKIPSQDRLWETCMNRSPDQLLVTRPFDYFQSRWIVGITQFPDHHFCDGSSVRRIRIDNNRLNDTRKLGFSSLDNCYTRCLTNLTRLDANNNAFQKVFNNSFCGLQGLKALELDNNRIKELERDAFINLKSLQYIVLSNNSITVLPPGVFREQQNISGLYMDNNALNSQSMTEIKNLKELTWLQLNGNQIDVLPNDVFKYMTQLVYLGLGNNLIKTLQGSLTNLINLQWLHISANNISVIRSGDFQNIIHIKVVYFSYNPIHTVEPEFCANCDQMAIVNIANASLTTLPKFISESTELKELDLSNNKIDQINAGAFDAGKDIDIIDLSWNLLTDIIVFTNCKVKQLILNHNGLTKLSFTDFSSSLKNLSITHNSIHTIDTIHDIIQESKWSLVFLNLSHNHLSEIADGSFDHLTVLKVLDLEHNNLSHIKENMLKNLNSLTQLFLSHNKIITVEPNAFPSQLQTLRLDNNQLVNYSFWKLDNLMNLRNLSVSGNQWSCDLSERLEKWLLENSHIVNDIGKIVCEQPNATVPPIPHSNHYPETTSSNLDELNSANEINSANGVVYANLWAWLFGLCVCITMCI